MSKKETYRSRLRDEQSAATRSRIVEAAAEGFAPWTTELPFNKVAERAGVSVRTVYRYFPTQLDLLNAARTRVAEGAGWKPDDVSSETLGSMIARAFAYFGDLLERAGHEIQVQAPGMADLRKQRLEAIERVVAPFSNGMDPEHVRGICAVLSGLGRIEFLRGMHEQWGLDGIEAGRAVEWAVGVLLDDLRRNAITEETKQ